MSSHSYALKDLPAGRVIDVHYDLTYRTAQGGFEATHTVMLDHFWHGSYLSLRVLSYANPKHRIASLMRQPNPVDWLWLGLGAVLFLSMLPVTLPLWVMRRYEQESRSIDLDFFTPEALAELENALGEMRAAKLELVKAGGENA